MDEVDGQGSRILPYVIFGVVCWYQLGNSFLVDGDFDVFSGLKTLFSGSNITYKLKGEASRLFPLFTSALDITSSTTATLTATAYDDYNEDHLIGGYYVESTAPIKTVNGFVAAALADSANAGSFDVDGTSQTIGTALTNKNYLNVLVISDDGSCSLISKQYNA